MALWKIFHSAFSFLQIHNGVIFVNVRLHLFGHMNLGNSVFVEELVNISCANRTLLDT